MNSSQSSSSSSTYRGTRGSRGRNHDSSSSIPSFHFNIHPYRRSRTTSQAAIIPHPLFKQTILTSPPPDLCLPSITNISPYIYVFGGSKPDITFTNDVYRMNAQNGIWEKLNTKGEKPRPRHRHTATYWKPNDHDSFLVIFGGNGEEYFNDVSFFFFLNNSFSFPFFFNLNSFSFLLPLFFSFLFFFFSFRLFILFFFIFL